MPDEKMMNCDVICGRTKNRCSVPSLPRYTGEEKGGCAKKIFNILVHVQCTVYTGWAVCISCTLHRVVQILQFYETSLIINKILMYSTSISLLLNGQLKL